MVSNTVQAEGSLIDAHRAMLLASVLSTPFALLGICACIKEQG